MVYFEAAYGEITQLRTYWFLSFFILSSGMIGVGYIIFDMFWRKNPLYHKTMFKGFVPAIIGDLLFLTTYWPYHTYNSFASINNDGYDISQERTWCKASLYGVAFAVVINLYGLVLVAYSLYITCKYVVQFRQAEIRNALNTKTMLKHFVFLFAIGVGWIVCDYSDIGSYRGLYCTWYTWLPVSGGILLGLVVGSMALTGYFFLSSYIIIRNHHSGTSQSGSRVPHSVANSTHQESVEKSTRNVILKPLVYLSIRFLAIFLICWGPFLFTVILSMAKVDVPIQYDMFSGVLIKFKVPLDVVLLVSLPAFSRKTKSSASASHEGAETKPNTRNISKVSNSRAPTSQVVSEEDI